MNSLAASSFWKAYEKLPAAIQKQAKEKFRLWQKNHYHPSLHYKCVNSEEQIWSARVTLNYRTLAVRDGDDVIWFWIGNHDDYEKLI